MNMIRSITSRLQGILVLFLIVLNVFFIVKIMNKQKNTETVPSNHSSDYAIRSLTEAVIIGYKTEGLPIYLRFNQDSLFLLTLMHNRALVLRISDTHCEACTTEALYDLLEYSSGLDAAVVVLTNFINSRSVDVFRISHPDFVVLNEASIDLPVERLNTPYFFLTDRTMLTDMVFVHQKEFPEKTKGYFEALQSRFEQ